jgi:hypothetical protein
MSTRDIDPIPDAVASDGPRPLPGGAGGATQLAALVGNRAFARSVAVREQPTEPTVQRLLIPLAIVGAGLIYVSGEQRGWWGGDEADAAAKTAGGADRLTKVKEQRAGSLRARQTLTNQVFSVIDNFADLVEPGTKEGAQKVKTGGDPLFGVLSGLAIGEGQRKDLEAAQDSFGEGLQTAAALTETRAETIDLATANFASAATAINGVLSGGTAPAPATPVPPPATGAAPAPTAAPAAVAPAPGPAPAPDNAPAGPPKPPIPADVVSSLKGVVESLGAAQKDLAALGEKGEPRDVVDFTKDIQSQLDAMSGSIPGEDGKAVQVSGFKVRNGVRHLQAMMRSREENGAHAAKAFRTCRTRLTAVFTGLQDADTLLAQEEKRLEAEKAGAGEEGPPPTEGGKK